MKKYRQFRGTRYAWRFWFLSDTARTTKWCLHLNEEAMCKGLQDLGVQVEWPAYEDGGHWLNELEGLDELLDFLSTVVV